MKKTLITLLAIVASMAIYAQTSPCPALKNPSAFTAGQHSGSRIGYYSGQLGLKEDNTPPNSLTGTTGFTMNSGPDLADNQLASQTSGGSSGGCGPTLDNSTRYRIMTNTEGPGTGANVGKDPIPSFNLPYTPTSFDPTITKSIRLGNCHCDGAEALYYNMKVSTTNCLLTLYYSIVVENPTHGPGGNPAFVVRVCKQNSLGQWQQISDTLCYAISSASASNGVDGWHSYSAYNANGFYRDWNKVVINLFKYLYQTVRIEFYIGDCCYEAHYGYCYIAGDCQPMSIQTSGCPAGATNTVQTLTAPAGLTNYVWYKCNIDGRFIANEANIPSDVGFTRLSPTTSTNNVYDCQVEDFRVVDGEGAGELTNNMVFMCEMTSAMDPAKPFITRLPVRVINTKPIMTIDTLKTCDGDLNLTNKSFVPNDMLGCDTSISKWWYYRGADTTTGVVDSTEGATSHHRYDSSGVYAVKVRSFNRDDHECFSDSTYTIFALGRPRPKIEASALEVCVDETVVLRDETPRSVRRDWIIYNDTAADPTANPVDTIFGNRSGNNLEISRVFEYYKNPVVLRAYNGLYTRDANNTYDTIWCTANDSVNIEVFQDPELTVTGDTVVCNGQQTDITVSCETQGCTYRWYRNMDDANQISEGPTLRTLPYDDTCIYYVKVISPKQCVAWDRVNAYRVNPTLSISRHDMCAGDEVSLHADKAFSYSWIAEPADSSLNELLDATGHGPADITVTPRTTTVYTLIGHGTNDCNAAPLTEQITVHPVPVATVDYKPSFVDSDNPVVTLTDKSPYSVRRVWYFEDGTPLMETTSPCSHNFGEVSSDSVEVTLVAYNDLECSDTLTFRLPVTQFTFFAPNAFTPERPDNNTFSIFTANEQENFSVFIYDRMGRQVYTSNDLHFKWNGTTMDGVKCPQGAYTYVIYYRRPGTEDIVNQKGTVTLIR